MKPRRVEYGHEYVSIDEQARMNKEKCNRIKPILVELLRRTGLEEKYCESISNALTLSELKAMINALKGCFPEVAEKTALDILISEEGEE